MARIRELDVLENYIETDGDQHFHGDRAVLLRVMQNLLINAIHHSPSGETVEAGFDFMDEDTISFYVKDNGPGILPQYQEAIFDKYVQISKKQEERSYSTGLGLTFCRLAIEAHKGKIFVQSDGENGSRFQFQFPKTGKI